MPVHRQCACCKAQYKVRLCCLNKTDILSYLKANINDALRFGDPVCKKCRGRYYNHHSSTEHPSSDVEHQLESPENKKIKLDIPRATLGESRCFICKMLREECKSKMVMLSTEMRVKIFIKTGILVPNTCRCCSSHIVNGDFPSDSLSSLAYSSKDTELDSSEISEILLTLRAAASKKSCLDFDSSDGLTDQDYYRLTGLYKNQFSDLLRSVNPSLYSTLNRSARTALAILLVKLRTGMSLSILASLFNMTKRICGKCIHSARQALMTHFVPSHLGLQHITREQVIQNHTTVFARKMFASGEDVAIAVADGTYIYVEKSSNYTFQRRSFSMHKGRPLLKPMLLVASDGYILSVLGPYLADGRNNDANITKHMLKTNTENIKDWFQDDDVLVVDRGFRDVTELLNDAGIKTEMPFFLPKGQKQHTHTEANESRLVTKVRWVVESANGRIKQWKTLGHVLPNTLIPVVGDFVRIVCAICNAFRPPLASDSPNDLIIAERMLALSKCPNKLQIQVEKEGLARKRAIWVKLDEASLPDFPQLTEPELRDLTMGVYQLKQAKSYTMEHLSEDGQYELMACREKPGLIKVQIRSRHVASKLYNLWIEYSPGLTPISGWYCQCKVGARVVGCCAHIASVLWYLSYERHQPRIAHPTASSSYLSCADDAMMIEDWSESDSDNE